MDLLNLLLSRRSIRRYTESPIPQRALETILAAGLLSPSSRGRRPWEFVVVQNPKTLEALSHCRQGSAAMLAGAKAAILVFADPEKTDVWTEDCAIAMSNMHLMAHHLGLGSCWIQGRLRQAEDGTSTEACCSPSRPATPWRPFSPWAFPPFSRSPTAWRTCPGKKFTGIPSNPFPGTVQKNVCTRSRPGTHVFI